MGLVDRINKRSDLNSAHRAQATPVRGGQFAAPDCQSNKPQTDDSRLGYLAIQFPHE